MSTTSQKISLAIEAAMAPPRTKLSSYPEPFYSRMTRREKRPLGDLFGLKNFGANLTTLLPGGESALLHRPASRTNSSTYWKAIRRSSRTTAKFSWSPACARAFQPAAARIGS
jgi:hypothetical protein